MSATEVHTRDMDMKKDEDLGLKKLIGLHATSNTSYFLMLL